MMAVTTGPVRFIGSRLLAAALTLLGLATVVFVMTRMIPGDEARVVAGSGASPTQVAQVQHELGLDRSGLVQYLTSIGRLGRGDLGISASSHHSVLSNVLTVIPSTIQLVALSLLIAWSIAVPAAAWAAARRGGAYDTVSRVLVIIAAGLPTFWLALLLQWLLGAKYQIFPVSGTMSIASTVPRRTGMSIVDAILSWSPSGVYDALLHLILPSVVLAIPLIMQFFRATRTETTLVLER
jgi:dipeptide transport system permease protein